MLGLASFLKERTYFKIRIPGGDSIYPAGIEVK